MVELVQILKCLYEKTGCDFREYRQSTLLRRIARRMHATGSPTYQAYLDRLTGENVESHNLLKELTIHVTEFFREPEHWETVAKKVFPDRLAQRTHDTVKIWSAGCATGEEAYSLAILIEEARCQRSEVRILGTDLDESSLLSAREGTYSEAKLKNLPIPLREKYLQRGGKGYQIVPVIRRSVQFRRLDLVGGECPGTFDLISCRNVLIYFSKELQETVLLKLHRALNPNGFLWLGKAESLWGRPRELFECVDKRAKIFRKGFNVCESGEL
ncbi:MAG: protein-glutamate O-methyltransferase CheR [Deltaproteobacteria bacterium]|nr:protein-glutamate O-methyltransferase CheR [Deltaproteobacteria bacterium]